MKKEEMTEEIIFTYDNFYEKKNHGNLEYPVMVYFVDLYKSYMHSVRWHWHEEMEIMIINSGRVEVLTDDNTCILEPGQCMIINQNVMHSFQSIDGSNCTYYSLVFHPDFLFGHTNSNMRTQFLLPVQSFAILKTMVLEEKNPWHASMLDVLNEVIAVNLTKNFGYEIATKGYLCQFWAILLNHLPLTSEMAQRPQISLDEQRVKQAMLFIRLHHAEPLTLDDIAESIPVSKSECCRCFKRTIQMTPFEYLMKYRIFEASKKILDDKKTNSISELALSVGFNNISYFNKLFKRYLGCTPTEYRGRIAEAAATTGTGPFNIPLL
ncbi:MAG: AraC family transcriptional regulator [Lachnospiraceae bacterium]|nr:AraC family transcriptional regulator [Lachnospiraceae bacterium]